MTGKEALDDYKDFGKIKGESITSNQTFVPSPFHNEWRQKYFEEIEEVNLRADMVCARNDELEDELAKYKRAFEVLKKADMFMLEESFGLYKALSGDKTEYLEKEEYELLEELMNCEEDK